jgi:hypothetical protein
MANILSSRATSAHLFNAGQVSKTGKRLFQKDRTEGIMGLHGARSGGGDSG